MNRYTVPDPNFAAPAMFNADLRDDNAEGMEIDLRLLWSTLYRQRKLILAIVAVVLAIGVIVTMLTTRQYRALATVQIEQQVPKVLSTEDPEPLQGAQEADRFLQTQTDLINSRALAEMVANDLGLANNPALFSALGIQAADLPQGTTPAERMRIVTRALQTNLSVTLPRNSRIAQIAFTSHDPAFAAQVANSYAKNYVVYNLRRRFDTSAYARGFLQQQLAEAKGRLEQSEREMVDYARQARLIDASSGIPGGGGETTAAATRSLTTSSLVDINSAYSRARAARVAAQQRWLQALATPVMGLAEVQANSAIQTLLSQRAQAQATLDQERQRYKPNYPQVQRAAAQVAALDRQISTIAGSVRGAIRDAYLTSLREEKGLSGNLEQLKNDTLAEQDRSIRYNILRRETDTNRTMYDGLLQRFKEVSAAAGVSANNISIVDLAQVPKVPVSPRVMTNLGAAALIGLVLALLAAFLREKFDDSINSPEEVQRKLGANFISSIPLLPAGSQPRQVLNEPRSALSEAYAALRTSLELVLPSGLPRSLLLTSSRQAEGKSTSAFAIARDFARIGKRVLLLDGDLRKPSLHRQFGLLNKHGLSSVLARHRDLNGVIQQTDIPNLDFVSSGPLAPNPAELLSGATLPELLHEAQERYDLVIVDGPPVLGLADAVLLATNLEATVFVVEANASHRGHAKAALRRLYGSGSKIMGVVLTKFDARKSGYGDDYGYSYSYGSDPVPSQN